MNILDKSLEFLTHLPLYGKVVAAGTLLAAINEWIEKYTKYNPLKSSFTYLFAYKKNHAEKKITIERKRYYSTVASEEYYKWSLSVLKKIYTGVEFVQVLGQEYPVTCFKAGNKFEYPFKGLLCKDELDINPQEYTITGKLQNQYKKLLGNTVKRPQLKGYMLDRLKLDESNNIQSLSAKVSTYEQNIQTSHILDYELFKLFSSKNRDVSNFSKSELLERLPLRNQIHGTEPEINVLTTGVNRMSLLGVQLFVIFKDHNDGIYKVLLIKRSEDVSVKPGYFQFIPSGGFEIWQNEATPFILKKNFSVESAIFRELVEEAFGEEEFIENENGAPEENIHSYPKIVALKAMIAQKEAFFEFLGSTVDLVSLRHELSFILRIDNDEFSKYSFKKNHESKHFQICTIPEIEHDLPAKWLNPGSAALLKMVKSNTLYTEIES